MFLGLHDTAFQLGILFFVLAAAAVAFLIWGRVKEGNWERLGLAITPVIILAGLGLVVHTEHGYDARDAAVRARLNRTGVSVVRMHGDDHVVVERDGCTADYIIQGGVLEYPKVWPLVAGTGKAVSGCTDDQIDARFIP